MIAPIADEEVKVFLKNGTTVEGIVVGWSKTEVVLRAEGSLDKLIIYQPQENIIMVRIVAPVEREERQPSHIVTSRKPTRLPPQVAPELPQETLRERAIRAAHQAAQNQVSDKKALAAKLRQPLQPNPGALTNYEFPDFTKRSPFNSSSKKNVRGA